MATITAAAQLGERYNGKDPLLQYCRDTYKISCNKYEDSIREGREIIDLYHGRQYTASQLTALTNNGQPAEYFNVIKMFTNAILGYLETVVTTVTAEPRYPGDSIIANILNDDLQATLDRNDWTSNEKFIKIDGLLTGLMCAYEEVVDSGEKDPLGRPIYDIKLSHVPSYQVRIDPHSVLEDYSDARFIHHFKWVTEEEVKRRWPEQAEKLIEYFNFLESDQEAEYGKRFNGRDDGEFKQYNNYLIVKSVVEHEGKRYSVIWCDYIILEQEEITFRKVKFPYRIVKLSKSDKAEYYGPFRDVIEAQKSINQAILQIQLLVDTKKAFVEEGAVDDIEEFRMLFSRINAVVPVMSLQGIKVENVSQDLANQYTIIDQALTRIKMTLGINDSFLGQAFASDSGRKVRLQQMASAAQLTSVVDRVGAMFKFVGEDVVGLIQQFHTAQQIIKVSDPLNAFHYAEINTPIMQPVGVDPQSGMPIMQPMVEPVLDPDTGDIMRDEEGNIILDVMSDPDSDITTADVDLRIVATRSDNADERNQLLFETMVNGPIGQMLLQVNPAGFFKTAAMQVSEMGTKHSIEIARILIETAQGIEQGQIDPRLAMYGGDIAKLMGGGAGGGATGNPQNTPGGLGAPGMGAERGGTPGGIPLPGREGGNPQ